MRCKKHLTDCSSAVGVCATCLRERLHILIQTQSNHQTSQVLLVRPQLEGDHEIQPQIVFPRSVSPYVSRRKTAAHLQRLYSTPQIGPNGIIITDDKKSSAGKFSIFSNLFRSKTHKLDFDAKPRNSNSDAPSWFSSLFAKKKMMSKSFPAFGDRRGMESDDGFSNYSSGSSPGWKETPIRATPQAKRKQNHVAGLAFCLSPLVRPSPNRSWTQKGVTPESVIPSGDVRVPTKPHLGAAASFRGNRSRKLANFGRLNPKY